MCSLETFHIDLRGLLDSTTTLEYNLDDAFFDSLEAPEVRRGQLHVDVVIEKLSNYYELKFHTEGTVIISCDKCLDDMEQPISTDNRLLVKYGEAHAEDEDQVTLADDEETLNVAWYIYEFIALCIPIKHVHRPDECNPAMIKALEEHSASRDSSDDGGRPTDPRWEALSKLKMEDQ